MKNRENNDRQRHSNILSPLCKEIAEGARLNGAVPPAGNRVERVTRALSLYIAPEPGDDTVKRLLKLVSREKSVFLHSPAHLARVILTQVRLFPLSFWLGAQAIILAGMLAALYFDLKPEQTYLMLAAIPWAGSLGTLFSLGQSKGAWGELELLSPVPPPLLALGRTLACIGIDTLAALLATAAVAALGWELSLFRFAVSWLVPLLLSAALALCFALFFGTARALVATTVIWGAQTIFQNGLGPLAFLSLPGDPYWAASKVIGFFFAAVCLGIACFYIKHRERKRVFGT